MMHAHHFCQIQKQLHNGTPSTLGTFFHLLGRMISEIKTHGSESQGQTNAHEYFTRTNFVKIKNVMTDNC